MTAEYKERFVSNVEAKIVKGEIMQIVSERREILASVSHSAFDQERLAKLMKYVSGSPSPEIHSHPLLGQTSLLIVGEEITYYPLNNAFTTGSNGSEAVYPAVGVFQDEGFTFMTQYLRAGCRTSWHTQPEPELFSNPSGEAFVYTDNDHVSPIGESKWFGPHEPHMIFTPYRPAITLIYQGGTSFRHTPVSKERPKMDRLLELSGPAGSAGSYR